MTASDAPSSPPSSSSALTKVAFVWAALAALIPAAVSVVLLTNPGPLIKPGAQLVDLIRVVGYRNIGYSLVLAVALFTQPSRVIAFLLFARGLTELGDGLSGVFSAPGPVPYIGGLGDILIGYYFLRRAKTSAT
jgi:hypothetical protein